MGFLDKVKDMGGALGEKMKQGFQTVSDGSQKLLDKVEVKKQISTIEKEINGIYVSIGKKYIENMKGDIPEDMAGYVNTLNEKTDELEKLKNQLDELNDKNVCPACGAPNQKGQKFCDKCGTRLVIEETAETETAESVEVTVVEETAPAEENTAE